MGGWLWVCVSAHAFYFEEMHSCRQIAWFAALMTLPVCDTMICFHCTIVQSYTQRKMYSRTKESSFHPQNQWIDEHVVSCFHLYLHFEDMLSGNSLKAFSLWLLLLLMLDLYIAVPPAAFFAILFLFVSFHLLLLPIHYHYNNTTTTIIIASTNNKLYRYNDILKAIKRKTQLFTNRYYSVKVW